MSESSEKKDKPTRREMLRTTARTATALALGGSAVFLTFKSSRADVWQIDTLKCVNSQLGATDVPYCDLCATDCVLALSAVRAVNDFSKCGRCYICPAYYDIMSEVDEQGLPSQILCPRDAIERKPIGDIDPDDPANNFYEYTINNDLCDGCGKCVMGCKEPAGLGSIRLEVRYDLCLECNRCAISAVCPEDAYVRDREGQVQSELAREEERLK